MNNKKNNTRQNLITFDPYDIMRSIANKIKKAVSITLGPKGNLALLDSGYNQIRFTKDGVSVIKNLNSTDPYESIILTTIKEACAMTNNTVGDGTTTTAILLTSIIEEGIKRIQLGYKPTDLASGLEKMAKLVDDLIIKNSIKAEEKHLKSVATISTNNDKFLGDIIYEAMNSIDIKYGLITVEESKTTNTTLLLTEGMKLNYGYLSPFFLSGQSTNIELDDVLVLIVNGKITEQDYILKLLEHLAFVNKSGLIVCNDIEKNLLGTLIVNNYQKIVRITAIKTGGEDESLEELKDLAALVGSKIINLNAGGDMKIFNENILGSCRRSIISQDSTSIIGGNGNKEEISERSQHIKKLIDENKKQDSYVDEKLKERYSKLSGKIAVIKVGAHTSSELNETKDRVNDAVAAIKSIYPDGVSLGGGIIFFKAQQTLKASQINPKTRDEEEGANILLNILDQPIKQILKNGDYKIDCILEKIIESKFELGYDAHSEKLCKLEDTGILDPTSVTRKALQIAVSNGKLHIRTKIITLSPQDNKTSFNGEHNHM